MSLTLLPQRVTVPRSRILAALQKERVDKDIDLLKIFALYPNLIVPGFQKGGIENPDLGIIHCKDKEEGHVFAKIIGESVNLKRGHKILWSILEFAMLNIAAGVREGLYSLPFRFFIIAPRYSRKFVSLLRNNPRSFGIELGYWRIANFEASKKNLKHQKPKNSETDVISIISRFSRSDIDVSEALVNAIALFQTNVYFMKPIERKILALCFKHGFINENKPPRGLSVLSLEYELAKQRLQRKGLIWEYQDFIVRSSIIGYIRRRKLLVQYSDAEIMKHLELYIDFSQ
ncbi:MAG: hypothetical protein ACFFBD_23630 [Candidatus Hodarchaeota archaeon]